MMQAYIGTKIVNARQMSQAAFLLSQGKTDEANEIKNDRSGYLIVYPDGYESWSPIEQFEEAYRVTTGLNFGLAIEAMKKGFKVARTGWNGKGMFCIYVPGTKIARFTPGTPYAVALKHLADEHGYLENQEILPHFDMYTTNAEGRRAMLPGWAPSQSDMDADDWMVV